MLYTSVQLYFSQVRRGLHSEKRNALTLQQQPTCTRPFCLIVAVAALQYFVPRPTIPAQPAHMGRPVYSLYLTHPPHWI